MLKNSFLILAMLFATNIATHAQNAEGVTKNMSFYICGTTSNINPDAGTVLDANGEVGITFAQNFAGAQWFNIATTMAFCVGEAGLVKDSTGKFVGSPVAHGQATGAYGKVNLSFGKYFALGFHTIGRLDFDLKYKMALANNQSLTFRAYMEILPTGNSLYATPTGVDPEGNLTGDITRRILNHFDVRLAYAVGFHPEWSYDTDVRFRFNGGSYAGEKADSIEAMKNSFAIRWNQTISYTHATNGFGAWFTFRYQPDRILVKGAVDHNVSLHTGITYSYDLSNL